MPMSYSLERKGISMLGWGHKKAEVPVVPAGANPGSGSGVPLHAAPPLVASRSLPELLVEEGRLDREQIDKALAIQRETGAFLGEVLVQEGLIDEKSMISLLAKHCKIPHLSLLDHLIDPEVVPLIPREVCLRRRVLPVDRLGRNLTVAMVNPLDEEALSEIRACCPDLRIKPILCASRHFEVVSKRFLDAPRATTEEGLISLTATSLGLKAPDMPQLEPSPSPAPPSEAPVAFPPENNAATLEEEIPEAIAFDDESADPDALSDTLFGKVFQQREPDPPPASSGAGEPAQIAGMASVMVESMRDTYDMMARRIDLFRGLDAESVARLFAHGVSVEAAPGQIIFRKGDSGDMLYVILSGEVQIFDGNRELSRLGSGFMFGEMALFDKQPRSAGARALTATSLLTLNLDLLQNILPKDVALTLLINIVYIVSNRLRKSNESSGG
jgi:hypothetical protein